MTRGKASGLRVRGERFSKRLAHGPPLLLDGATGTALEDEGCDTSGPLWSAEVLQENPGAVARLHGAYAEAGAEVHTAVTFRTHPGLFEGRGGERAWRSTLHAGVRAVEQGIERAGVDRDSVWVAGSLAPVGESYAPGRVPIDSVLEREHGAQARGLADAGVDLILVETMVLLREAVIATRAGVATGLPVAVAFVVGPGAKLLSGESLAEAVQAIRDAGAQMVLVNCSSLDNSDQAVEVLADQEVPWGVYANGSTGDPVRGWGPRVSPEAYAEAARRWIEAGARLVGSCCATGPGHTRALERVLQGR